YFQDFMSEGAVPLTSINDSSSLRKSGPELMRSRMVLSVTNCIRNGSSGETAYSVVGNSLALAFSRRESMLLKACRVAKLYRLYFTVPVAVFGSKDASSSTT